MGTSGTGGCNSFGGIMSNTWFSSDLHLGHARLLEFCRETRSGETIQEHDELLIEAWNTVVSKGDVVYILGDECLGDREVGYSNISRLNGQKHLIKGNHTQLRKQHHKEVFQSISDLKQISVTLSNGIKQEIIMCHFPLLSWNRMDKGSWMLHGHCHGSLIDLGGKIFDCGIDNRKDNHMLPFSLEEIEEYMKTRSFVERDHHR